MRELVKFRPKEVIQVRRWIFIVRGESEYELTCKYFIAVCKNGKSRRNLGIVVLYEYFSLCPVLSLTGLIFRRFIYVETAFFWKWWEQQPHRIRKIVKRLVHEGRLEFIGGSWSMHDEATTHYHSIVDGFTWGFRLVRSLNLQVLFQCKILTWLELFILLLWYYRFQSGCRKNQFIGFVVSITCSSLPGNLTCLLNNLLNLKFFTNLYNDK